jgi:hypothetical protein
MEMWKYYLADVPEDWLVLERPPEEREALLQ